MDNRKIPIEKIYELRTKLLLCTADTISRSQLMHWIPKTTWEKWERNYQFRFCRVLKEKYYNVNQLLFFLEEYPSTKVSYCTPEKNSRRLLGRVKQSLSKRGIKHNICRPALPQNVGSTPGITKTAHETWHVIITIRGVRYYLGTYADKADAIAARQEIENYAYKA